MKIDQLKYLNKTTKYLEIILLIDWVQNILGLHRCSIILIDHSYQLISKHRNSYERNKPFSA